jgi:phosphopantothenate synthetase
MALATVRIVTVAGPVTVLSTDQVVVVNKAAGEATLVNLFAFPATGTRIVIKDGRGDAATNPLTIVPAMGTIDGIATYAMNVDRQSTTLFYSGAEWEVI